ncbi:MAG: energy transducer TonB [Burkholderiaceae bacterium]|nr:energy transducer TonB [Burkholderiaceae bacterium]
MYPAVSRRLGEQGRVLLRVLVGLAGEPERIEVLQSSGYPKLDGAAREAARRSRFRPYVEDGKATPVWALIPIHFALES